MLIVIILFPISLIRRPFSRILTTNNNIVYYNNNSSISINIANNIIHKNRYKYTNQYTTSILIPSISQSILSSSSSSSSLIPTSTIVDQQYPPIKVITININGIKTKLNNMISYIQQHNINISCIQETNLTDGVLNCINNNDITISNHNLTFINTLSIFEKSININDNDKLTRGKGLLILIHNISRNIDILDKFTNNNMITVLIGNTIYVNTYINPSNINNFKSNMINHLIITLNEIISDYPHNNIFVLGDYNYSPNSINTKIIHKLNTGLFTHKWYTIINSKQSKTYNYITFFRKRKNSLPSYNTIDNILMYINDRLYSNIKMFVDANSNLELNTDHNVIHMQHPPIYNYDNYNITMSKPIIKKQNNNLSTRDVFIKLMKSLTFRRYIYLNIGLFNNHNDWLELSQNFRVNDPSYNWNIITNHICNIVNHMNQNTNNMYLNHITSTTIRKHQHLKHQDSHQMKKLKDRFFELTIKINKLTCSNNTLYKNNINHMLNDRDIVNTNIKQLQEKERMKEYGKKMTQMLVLNNYRDSRKAYKLLTDISEYNTTNDLQSNTPQLTVMLDIDTNMLLTKDLDILNNWVRHAKRIVTPIPQLISIITLDNTSNNIINQYIPSQQSISCIAFGSNRDLISFNHHNTSSSIDFIDNNISDDEIRTVLVKSENYKSCGSDYIPVEILKSAILLPNESLSDYQNKIIKDNNVNTQTITQHIINKHKSNTTTCSPIGQLIITKVKAPRNGGFIKIGNILNINQYTTSQNNDDWRRNPFLLALIDIYQSIYSSSTTTTPADWSNSNIIYLHKKGDKRITNNYRPISLIPVYQKVFHTILNRRLMNYLLTNSLIHYEQVGFLPDEETSVQVISLLEILARREAMKQHLEHHHNEININNNNENNNNDPPSKFNSYIVFLDLEKAYDTVPHEDLFNIIENEFKIPQNSLLYSYIKHIYNSSQVRLQFDEKFTEYIKLERGLRQGCPLSPTLFIMFINHIIKKIRYLCGVIIPTHAHSNPNTSQPSIASLWFADDAVAFASSIKQLIDIILLINNELSRYNMKLNFKKCAIMPMFNAVIDDNYKCIIDNEPHLIVNNDIKIPITNQYKYLGHVINNTLDIDYMMSMKRKNCRLDILKSKNACLNKYITVEAKKQLINSTLIPKLLPNPEIWGMTNSKTIILLQKDIDIILKNVLGLGAKNTGATVMHLIRREIGILTVRSIAFTSTIRCYIKFGNKNQCNNTLNFLLHHPPPHHIINNQVYSISKHINILYILFHKFILELSLPTWFKSHINNITLNRLSNQHNNIQQIPSRSDRNSPISNLVINNTTNKPNYILDLKEIIDNITQHDYMTKRLKDMIAENVNNPNYMKKCPTTYNFWLTNNIPGSEHRIRTIETATPSIVIGWNLLHLVRIDAYIYTHRWSSTKSPGIKCIGCKSVNIIEDAYHLLTSCPQWSDQRAQAFRDARSIVCSSKEIITLINDIKHISLINNNNTYNPGDVSIFDDIYADGVKAQEWLQLQSLAFILSGNDVGLYDDNDIRLHQSLVWIWMALFLQSVNDERLQLLSDTGSRF